MLTARDVMTRDVRTVPADWSLDELATFLADHSISGAPVVDEKDRTIGIVSLTDLVRNRNAERTAFPDAHDLLESANASGIAPSELSGYGLETQSELRVRDIMTPLVYDVAEDTPVNQIADAMIRGRIHRVVVTKGARAVGIVSSLDLLQIVRDLKS